MARMEQPASKIIGVLGELVSRGGLFTENHMGRPLVEKIEQAINDDDEDKVVDLLIELDDKYLRYLDKDSYEWLSGILEDALTRIPDEGLYPISRPRR